MKPISMTGCEVDEFLEVQEVAPHPRTPHILVIDDDPLFRAHIRRQGQKRGLPLTVCGSLKEVEVLSTSTPFDSAIVDYYLDDLRSYLRGTDIAALLESTPVVLISNSDHPVENATTFPESVRRFVNKRIGVNAILDAAVNVTK